MYGANIYVYPVGQIKPSSHSEACVCTHTLFFVQNAHSYVAS